MDFKEATDSVLSYLLDVCFSKLSSLPTLGKEDIKKIIDTLIIEKKATIAVNTDLGICVTRLVDFGNWDDYCYGIVDTVAKDIAKYISTNLHFIRNDAVDIATHISNKIESNLPNVEDPIIYEKNIIDWGRLNDENLMSNVSLILNNRFNMESIASTVGSSVIAINRIKNYNIKTIHTDYITKVLKSTECNEFTSILTDNISFARFVIDLADKLAHAFYRTNLKSIIEKIDYYEDKIIHLGADNEFGESAPALDENIEVLKVVIMLTRYVLNYYRNINKDVLFFDKTTINSDALHDVDHDAVDLYSIFINSSKYNGRDVRFGVTKDYVNSSKENLKDIVEATQNERNNNFKIIYENKQRELLIYEMNMYYKDLIEKDPRANILIDKLNDSIGLSISLLNTNSLVDILVKFVIEMEDNKLMKLLYTAINYYINKLVDVKEISSEDIATTLYLGTGDTILTVIE